MARLEIRSQGSFSVVELGADAVPLGFDAGGRAAWGKGQVARQVAEISGDTLRTAGGERTLSPGERVDVGGLELVYQAGEGDVRAAALNEIGHLLGTVESIDGLVERILDAMVRVLRVRRVALALLDDDEVLAVRGARADGIGINAAIARAALDAGAAILTSEAAVRDEREDEVSIDVRSILCAPLRDGGRAQGVLYADNEGRATSFSNDELDFASALAHLASFAMGNLARTERLREENTLLKRRLGVPGSLVAASPAMEEIRRKVEKVAGFDATVLITGESGVGKEMVAREIHAKSARERGPFVAVNCAAIPDTLLESELFGYAPQSALAGADPKGRAGKFEQADGGSIFLDEIGELKQELQAKLLRVLEDKRVDRINDTAPRPVDLRILVATNQNLGRLVADGRFREDLFYRLNVVAIEVPPLRRRREDIAPLAEFFLRTYPGPEELRKARLSKAAARALETYHWPGNVRELRNCIEQALILGDGKTIRLADLPPQVRASAGGPLEDLPPLVDVERDHIARVLRATDWNKARSARLLGISKPTLYDKIRTYGLAPD
ncbi:MAG: sigma 54-interacting transcriptional regulator [Planctomycetes bacterium]|nr:sigma 54-interacting transcriptional regulator [Planctomycetota bacterium]